MRWQGEHLLPQGERHGVLTFGIMHLGHFSFELAKSLFASLLAHIVRHRSQSSGIFVWLSLLLSRGIARVTESVAQVLDFVVASLVSAYFRLINLLFKACLTVLESVPPAVRSLS